MRGTTKNRTRVIWGFRPPAFSQQLLFLMNYHVYIYCRKKTGNKDSQAKERDTTEKFHPFFPQPGSQGVRLRNAATPLIREDQPIMQIKAQTERERLNDLN